LQAAHAQAQLALPGNGDEYIVDHRRAELDPYVSLYGAAAEAEIAKSLRAQGHVCVTELIEHMVKESAAVFKGTVHEDDWVPPPPLPSSWRGHLTCQRRQTSGRSSTTMRLSSSRT
jgi:hypothetical protein